MQAKRRILVAIYHSYFDVSSGAAISLRDMMEGLVQQGFEVRVLSGPKLDYEATKSTEELLNDQSLRFKTFRSSFQGEQFNLHMLTAGGVECGVWVPADPQGDPSEKVGKAWLTCYSELLHSWHPDIVVTYGGFWMTKPMMRLAKQCGARTVFYLCKSPGQS